MSLSEKRERCRQLQASVAAILDTAPAPQEVTGALGSELENLATLYTLLIAKLPLINPILQTAIQEVPLDEVLSHASEMNSVIGSLSIRSVPFSKEMLNYSTRLINGVETAKSWLDFEVGARLTRDFLGTMIENPPFMTVVNLTSQRKEDVEAMLQEARRQHLLRQLLQRAKVILGSTFAALDGVSTRADVVKELGTILDRVGCDRESLPAEACDVADKMADVKLLLELIVECEDRCEQVASAAERLHHWMPTDPAPAFASAEAIRSIQSNCRLEDLPEHREVIVQLVSDLRDSCYQVEALRQEAVGRFERLKLLTNDELESVLGSTPTSPTVQRLLSVLFTGWTSLQLSDDQTTAIAICGSSGEMLRLDHRLPVACDASVRADVFLATLSRSAQASMTEQYVRAARMAHDVSIGATKLDVAALMDLSCQAALSFVYVLWTTVAEGAFRAAEEVGSEEAATSERDGGRTTTPTPAVSSVAASRLLPRPMSASQRLTAVTRSPPPSVMALAEPRPGSASPTLFRRPKDGANAEKKNQKPKVTDDRRGSLPRLAHDEDASLASFFPGDGDAANETPVLRCPTRDRKLSSKTTASTAATLMQHLLDGLVSLKLKTPESRWWWIDAVAALTYALQCIWNRRGRHLKVGDVAWRREPRMYFSKAHAALSFEVGSLRVDNRLEFHGWMHRTVLLTESVHDMWCKLSTSFMLQCVAAVVGEDRHEVRRDAVLTFAALTGRFVAVWQCTADTTIHQVERFLDATAECKGMAVLENVELLHREVQRRLALKVTALRRDGVDADGAGLFVILTSDKKALTESLASAARVCYLMHEASHMARVEAWMVCSGVKDPAASSRKLCVTLSSLQSVSGVAVDESAIRRCLLTATRTVIREGSSITHEVALFNAMKAELEPTIPLSAAPFFRNLGRQLFAAESNITLFPKVAESILRAVDALGLESSDSLLARVVEAYEALHEAPPSQSVIALLGPSGSGKTTLLQVLLYTVGYVSISGRPTVLELMANHVEEDLLAAVDRVRSTCATGQRVWAVVKGVLPSSVQNRLSDLLGSDEGRHGLAIFVDGDHMASPSVCSWPRVVAVAMPEFSHDSWRPSVTKALRELQATSEDGAATSFHVATQLFESYFFDAVQFSLKYRSEGSAQIPPARMALNSISLFCELFRAVDWNRVGGGVASESAVERIFWLACTWGCESDRPRLSWSEFVEERLSGESSIPADLGVQSIHHVWIDTATGNWMPWSCLLHHEQQTLNSLRIPLLLTPSTLPALVIGRLYLRSGRLGVCGPACTGKTLLAHAAIRSFVKDGDIINIPIRNMSNGSGESNQRVAEGLCILDAFQGTAASRTCLQNARHDPTVRFAVTACEADEIAPWCPSVFIDAAIDEHVLGEYLFERGSKVAEGIVRLRTAMLASPLLCAFASTTSLVSLKWATTLIKDRDAVAIVAPLVFQHLAHRCNHHDQVAALASAVGSSFGMSCDDVSQYVVRDPSSGEFFCANGVESMNVVAAVIPEGEVIGDSSLGRSLLLFSALSSPLPSAVVSSVPDGASSEAAFVGNLMVEVEMSAGLLGTRVQVLKSVGDLAVAAPHSDVIVVRCSLIANDSDTAVVECAVLRGVRLVFDAVGCNTPSWNRAAAKIISRSHVIFSRVPASDLRMIARECIKDETFADAVGDMFFYCSGCDIFKAISVQQFRSWISGLDDARSVMERASDEQIQRVSDVLRFMRRIELATAGKSVVSPAEQQYEIREQAANRALEGRIVFRSVPPRPVRLIAQFNINYEEGRFQEIVAPSVFFGTAREDVVAVPATSGGTCRARTDVKNVTITTGILDFQLTVETFEPLILSGTVTDPSQGNSVVGHVRLVQLSQTEGGVMSKKWLRFGPGEAPHDDESLIKPMELPSEAQLQMNRLDADRYISRVGSMAKTLQLQLESLLLQRAFSEFSKVPGFLAGRTLLRLLLQMPLEDRTALIAEAQKTPLVLEDPLSLPGLASLLGLHVYEVELWLMQQRSSGLAYGVLSEQNACGLRYLIETASKATEEPEDTEDSEQERPPARHIAVLDEDENFVEWAKGYCSMLGVKWRCAETLLLDDVWLGGVQFVRHVAPAQRPVVDAISTKMTLAACVSRNQMMLARPEPGSNGDKSAFQTLTNAVTAQGNLKTALQALLDLLFDQFEAAEAQSSVVSAIVEIGKEKVPQLIDVVKKTKDALSAADSYTDRSSMRWKSSMENALQQAERVGLLEMGCIQLLPRISSSYILPYSYRVTLVRDAIAASGKNVTDAATRAFCTPILLMLRLEHRLEFAASLSTWILCRSTNGSSSTLGFDVAAALRAARNADPRDHIAREQQLKLEAAAAYDEYRASLVQPTGGGKASKSSQQAKREAKDFLSPEVKPPYAFMSYALWSQIVAVSKSIPTLQSLTANLQFTEVPVRGVLRQEKWTEWFSNPSIAAVPTYEKDTTVSALEKLLLIHVARPERTLSAALQLVADTLGNEIPDPLAFDDLGSVLAQALTATNSRIAVVLQPKHPVCLLDCVNTAVALKSLEQRKDSRGAQRGVALSPASVTEIFLGCTFQLDEIRPRLEAAVASDDWILLHMEELERPQSDEPCEKLMTYLSNVPLDYSGHVVIVCPVDPPLQAPLSPSADHRPLQPSHVALRGEWPRVACNEPSSVRARMQRFYRAPEAPLATMTVSHRVIFLIHFLVAAVAQRCRFDKIGFTEPERAEEIHADVSAATLILRQQIPSYSAKHWDEVRALMTDVVGSSIRDPRDRNIILALIDWLIHPDVANQDQMGFLQMPSASNFSAHMEAVSQLAAVDSATHIGMNPNEERRLLELEGKQLMVTLVEVAAIASGVGSSHLSSSPSSSPSQRTSSSVTTIAISMMRQLPPVWSSGQLTQVVTLAESEGGTSALNKFLLEEVATLQRLLVRLHSDCEACVAGSLDAQQRLAPLVDDRVPACWLQWSLGHEWGLHRLSSTPLWLKALHNRSRQLELWARDGCPRVLSLGSLASPEGFLAAFRLDACQQQGLDASLYQPALQVIPPASATTLPALHSDAPLAEGCYLLGVVLEGGAALNPRGVIADPPDVVTEWWRETAAPIPLIKLCLEESPDDSSDRWSRGGPTTVGLSRIQEAIHFSRSTAAVTLQRPSSAAGRPSRPVSAVGSPSGSPTKGSVPSARFVFRAPLYRTSLRRRDDFVCEIPISSFMEHNYWMIRGVVALCEP